MLTQQSDSSWYLYPQHYFLTVSTPSPQIKQTTFQVHWKVDCLEFKLSFPKETVLEIMDWVPKGKSTECSPGPSCLQGEGEGWSAGWGKTEGQHCRVSRYIQQRDCGKCQVGSVPRGPPLSGLCPWQPTVRGQGVGQVGGLFTGGCQYQGRLSKRGRPDGTSRRHVEDPSASTKEKGPLWSVGN